MSDEELRDLTPEFRARLEKGRLSTTCSRGGFRRRPRGGHPHLWGSATTTCRSWEVRHCTWATSQR